MKLAMDVFHSADDGLQAYLRDEEQQNKPGGAILGMFNSHFDQGNGVGLLVIEATLNAKDAAAPLVQALHEMLHQHLQKHLMAVEVVQVEAPSPTGGEFPQGFAIQRRVQTHRAQRIVLVESTEQGVKEGAPDSVWLEVYNHDTAANEPGKTGRTHCTMLIFDKRLQQEAVAKNIFDFIGQQVPGLLDPNRQLTVDLRAGTYLGHITINHDHGGEGGDSGHGYGAGDPPPSGDNPGDSWFKGSTSIG